MKFTLQLELEVDAANGEELVNAHGNELTNEEFVELEAAEAKEQENDEPVEPRRFITKEMVTAFREISLATAIFEKVCPNSSRLLKVQRGIYETLECYKEIYEKRKEKGHCLLLVCS